MCIAAVVLSTLLLPAQAPPSAPLTIDSEQLRLRAADYYASEESGGAAVAVIGLVSMFTSALFVVEADEAFVGAAIPFVALGAFQVVVGGSGYFSSDARNEDAVRAIARRPKRFVADETRRMASDALYYTVARIVEIGMVVAGAGVGILGLKIDEPLVTGMGFGFGGQALLIFIFDLVASARADRYAEGLPAIAGPRTPMPTAMVVPVRDGVAPALGFVMRF